MNSKFEYDGCCIHNSVMLNRRKRDATAGSVFKNIVGRINKEFTLVIY